MLDLFPFKALWERYIVVSKTWSLASSISPVDPRTIAIPPLQLHDPDLSFLSTPGLLPLDALELAAEKVRAVNESVRAIQQRRYADVCQAYLGSPEAQGASAAAHNLFFATVRESFQAVYEEQFNRIKAGFYEVCEAHVLQLAVAKEEVKKPFNNDCLPLLETYFEYQPFPTARDRQWLAEKSGNTVEQISTWFQNHRRRAKEAGRVIKRLPVHLQPVEIPLESLEAALSPLLMQKIRERSRSVESDTSSSTPPPELPVPVLDNKAAPPHAFPAKFSETANAMDQNFPCRQGAFQSEPLTWRRRPSSKRPRYEPYSIEKCSEDLKTLMRIAGRGKKRSEGTEPWFAYQLAPGSIPDPRHRPTPEPTSGSRVAPSRRTVTPLRQTAKPYDLTNRSSISSQSPQRRSPIPRKGSDSSIGSHASSSSAGEPPLCTPSPQRFHADLPAVHGADDDDVDSLFGPSRPSSPEPSLLCEPEVPCLKFGEPSLLASKSQLRVKRSPSRRLASQRYGFARYSEREASFVQLN